MIESLWEKDIDRATEILSDLFWGTISYKDSHEDSYHAFLAGIFVGRGYEGKSNEEKGLGRTDFLLKDRKTQKSHSCRIQKIKEERKP